MARQFDLNTETYEMTEVPYEGKPHLSAVLLV